MCISSNEAVPEVICLCLVFDLCLLSIDSPLVITKHYSDAPCDRYQCCIINYSKSVGQM